MTINISINGGIKAGVLTPEGKGRVSWTHKEGDRYIVVGIMPRTRRKFRIDCGSNWMQAEGINLWQGRKWLERGGKRYLLQRVTN